MNTSYTQDYFVTTWNTQAGTGQTGNTTIMLPITSGRYDVDANGDGIFEMTNLQGKQPIDFGTGNAGIKTIAVRPTPIRNEKNQLRINNSAPGSTPQKLISIDKWGSIVWISMQSAFQGCSNMTIADDAGAPNLTGVENRDMSMLHMFSGAINFNSDISSWNVSNVKDMRFTFSGATSFTSDLSSWNVSQVTSMKRMFSGTTSFNGDISTWDISNVTDMLFMFESADSFSAENYDVLLIGWSKLRLQPNVSFKAPPTTYCKGKQARELLRFTRGWIIQGDLGEDCSRISVDEEFLSNTKIYPNPTRGKLTIESSFLIDKLELYNILGVKLFSVSKTNTLDLKNLKQGIYILKIFSADKVISKKVIKD